MLSSKKEIEVQFNDLDPLNIVWHGNYIKYFEAGREHFGRKYGISYVDIREAGLATPIITLKCDFKMYSKYGDILVVETSYEACEASKIILNYTIRKKANNEVVASGQTIQVFTDHSGVMQLYPPEFYINWKNKWGVTK